MGLCTVQHTNAWVEPAAFAASIALTLLIRRAQKRHDATVPLSTSFSEAEPAPVALVRGKRTGFPIIRKTHLSHDTILLRFALPTERHVLGLPAGQHLFCYGAIGDEQVVRAYSTVTSPETLGYFEIALKVYYPDPPQYPTGGRMSQYLNGLSVGDVVEFKGPVGRFVYEGMSIFSKNRKKSKATQITMIAGGTGINPFIQILRKVLSNPDDTTRIRLVYANKTEKDILFRHELERLEHKYRNFSLFMTVEKPTWHWPHGRGRVDYEMLQRHTFASGEKSVLLLCGPGPMTDAVSEICTQQLGWSKDQIAVF